jgi:hypothetical protein
VRRPLALALLLALLPGPALARTRVKAEPPPVLAEGARVRVTLIARDSSRVVGTLLALRPEALDVETRTIPRLDIRKLEISRGMHSKAGNYAGKAALVGLALGAYGGAKLGKDLGNERDDAVVLGVVGGLLGALVYGGFGALIGSGIQEERWVEVKQP